VDRIRDRTGVDRSAGPVYIPAIPTPAAGVRRRFMRRSASDDGLSQLINIIFDIKDTNIKITTM